MRIYLDTNVFISLFQEEIGFGFRPLYVEARDFFERANRKSNIICISSLFLKEVKKILSMDQDQVIEEFIKRKINLEIIEDPDYKEILFFKNLGIHSPDYIHAATTRKSCDCIVTFNIKDFKKAREFISVFSPDDL